PADQFLVGDLREPGFVEAAVSEIDEVYQLACDMGGAGYIFTGEHDASVMTNNVLINANVARAFLKTGCRLLYTSSSCVYNDDMADAHAGAFDQSGQGNPFKLNEFHAEWNHPSNG